MKSYKYEGLSSGGERIEGLIEAFDSDEAMRKAKENVRVVLSLKPVRTGKNILSYDVGQLFESRKFSDKELSLLCGQLAVGLRAGLTVVRSMELSVSGMKNSKKKKAIGDAAADVKAGRGLADSFSEHCPGLPHTFSETVRAGEKSGQLAGGFEKLSEYYGTRAGLRTKVIGAMIYPAILLIVAAVVMAIIMIFAVPVFEKAFSQLGTELPAITKVLISFSGFLSDFWLVLPAAAAVLFIALRLLNRTEKGKSVFARIALGFPGIGRINRMNAAADFSSTVATMLMSGLTLVKAVETAGEVTDNLLIRREIQNAKKGLLEGKTLTGGIGKSRYFPDLLKEMVNVGEETGSLPETLRTASVHYRNEVGTAVQRAIGILEPVLILILAALVVMILFSVYLPLFGLYGVI